VVNENDLRPNTTRNAGAPDAGAVLGHDLSSAEQEYGGSSRVKTWLEEDVVVFLSRDGDSIPIHLWRKRPVASKPTLNTVTVEASPTHTVNAEEAEAERLKDLFVKNGLGAQCADVCKELGVVCVNDLKEIGKEDLDELPPYVKDQLKSLHKKRLQSMIGTQAPCPIPGAQSGAEASTSRLTSVPSSPPASTAAGETQADEAEAVVDAGLKAVFEQHGLTSLCLDVCRGMGVDCVDDLHEIKEEDLDELPKYVKEKLRPLHKRRLIALIGAHSGVEVSTSRHTPVPSQAALGTAAGETQADEAEESLDEGLKTLFEQHRLGVLCADVCKELGVDGVDDLAFVTQQHVDELLKLHNLLT
jgi:hypothetical protein